MCGHGGTVARFNVLSRLVWAPYDARYPADGGWGGRANPQVFAGSGVGDPTLPLPQSHSTSGSGSYAAENMGMMHALSTVSTLDEEVMTTLMRDVRRVADNIRLVLLPKSAAASEVRCSGCGWGRGCRGRRTPLLQFTRRPVDATPPSAAEGAFDGEWRERF